MENTKKMTKELNALFWTQFTGALNDNIFKNALIILITYQSVYLFQLNSKMLVALAGGVFILPFFLFSATSGELSLKYDRVEIARFVKIFEVIIMILAAMGFFLQNYYLLFVVLFLLGIHSTLFGPIKYSLIPEFIHDDHLVFANAIISAGTFVAILLGTILGGLLASGSANVWALKFILILVAAIGVYFSFKLPTLGAHQADFIIDWNIKRSTFKIIKSIIHDREILGLLFGLSWFWFLGAGILSLVPTVAKDIFHGKEALATLMLFIFTLGMGTGPFTFDRITKGKIYRAIIPVSIFLMSLFLFDIAFIIKEITNGHFLPEIFESISLKEFFRVKYSSRLLFDLFAVSFLGGIFTVTQYTELQRIVDKGSLSQIIAGNNILNAIFMVAVSLLIMFLFKLQFSVQIIFGFIGILNIGAGIILVLFHRHEFDNLWSF